VGKERRLIGAQKLRKRKGREKGEEKRGKGGKNALSRNIRFEAGRRREKVQLKFP